MGGEMKGDFSDIDKLQDEIRFRDENDKEIEFNKIEGDIKEALAEIEDDILSAAARLESAEKELLQLQDINKTAKELGQETIDESTDLKIIEETKRIIAKLEDVRKTMRAQLSRYYEVDALKYKSEKKPG